MTAERIQLYSIWRRDDGAFREVFSVESWWDGRGKSGQAVHTEAPRAECGIDRWRMRAAKQDRVPIDRFYATHEPLTEAEQAAARPYGYQLDLSFAAADRLRDLRKLEEAQAALRELEWAFR